MPKFILKLDCNNAAFAESPELEIARILKSVAKKAENNGLTGFFQTIHDINGNDVGRFAIKNNDGSNYNG